MGRPSFYKRGFMRGIIYHGESSAAEARALAKERGALLCDAAWFDGEAEPCESVTIMPDVPGWQRNKIAAAYPDIALVVPSKPRELNIVAIDADKDIHVQAEPVKRKRGRPRKVIAA